MGGSHHGDIGAGMYRPGDSPIHRLPPQVKIVSAVLFVFCVVATPREAFWAFGVYAAMLVAIAVIARIPSRWIARRSLIEVPFVVLAVLLPFAGGVPRIEVLGLDLSEPGLLAAWNLLAKGTLGVVTSILLASTTPLRDLLVGLQQLRLPSVFTQIATLMVRYLAVIVDQARRMRIARFRGGRPSVSLASGLLGAIDWHLVPCVPTSAASASMSQWFRVATPAHCQPWTKPGACVPWALSLTLPILGLSISVAAWVTLMSAEAMSSADVFVAC